MFLFLTKFLKHILILLSGLVLHTEIFTHFYWKLSHFRLAYSAMLFVCLSIVKLSLAYRNDKSIITIWHMLHNYIKWTNQTTAFFNLHFKIFIPQQKEQRVVRMWRTDSQVRFWASLYLWLIPKTPYKWESYVQRNHPGFASTREF